jgi:hypothetical protein
LLLVGYEIRNGEKPDPGSGKDIPDLQNWLVINKFYIENYGTVNAAVGSLRNIA